MAHTIIKSAGPQADGTFVPGQDQRGNIWAICGCVFNPIMVKWCPLHAQAEGMRAYLLEVAHQLPDPPPPGTYWTDWEGPHQVCLSVQDTARLRAILRAVEGK